MNIAIIGCGNMGMAYAHSLRKYDLAQKESLLLIEKNEARQQHLAEQNIGRVVSQLNAETLLNCDIIIVSVKPQDFDELAQDLRQALHDKITVLSIMAGKTLAYLQKTLQHPYIVRAMPNSPALVGMGITAYVHDSSVELERLRKIETLINTTGRCVYIENEVLMDAVTALSGSGPAYFFYIVQHMIQAGMQMGLSEHIASLLVKQTLLGSYHIMNNNHETLEQLIKKVASKGGTTEAALQVLDEHQVGEFIQKAIHSAEQRGKALAKS